jgi:hypothetical protein
MKKHYKSGCRVVVESLFSLMLFFSILFTVYVLFLSLTGDVNENHFYILIISVAVLSLQYITQEFQIAVLKIILYLIVSLSTLFINIPLDILKVIYNFFLWLKRIKKLKRKTSLVLAKSTKLNATKFIEKSCFKLTKVVDSFSKHEFSTDIFIGQLIISSIIAAFGYFLFLLIVQGLSYEDLNYFVVAASLLYLLYVLFDVFIGVIQWISTIIKIIVLLFSDILKFVIFCIYLIIISPLKLSELMVNGLPRMAQSFQGSAFVKRGVLRQVKEFKAACLKEDYVSLRNTYTFWILVCLMELVDEEIRKYMLDDMKTEIDSGYNKLAKTILITDYIIRGSRGYLKSFLGEKAKELKGYFGIGNK